MYGIVPFSRTKKYNRRNDQREQQQHKKWPFPSKTSDNDRDDEEAVAVPYSTMPLLVCPREDADFEQNKCGSIEKRFSKGSEEPDRLWRPVFTGTIVLGIAHR